MKDLKELNISIEESDDENVRIIKINKPSKYLTNAIYLDVADNLLLFLARDDFHNRIILDIDDDYFSELIEYLTMLDPTDRFVKNMEVKNFNNNKTKSM